MDGSWRETLVNTSLGWPNGIALDVKSQTIYWGDAQKSCIERANTDGSNRTTFLSADVPHIFGLSLLGKAHICLLSYKFTFCKFIGHCKLGLQTSELLDQRAQTLAICAIC